MNCYLPLGGAVAESTVDTEDEFPTFIMPGEIIKYVHKESCNMIFTEALIIRMKTTKECKCPIIRE